jgi:hypothetical protein
MKRVIVFGFVITFLLTACANRSTLSSPDLTEDVPQFEGVTTPVSLTQTFTLTPLLEVKPTATDIPAIQAPTASAVYAMKWRFQDFIEPDQPQEALELQGSIVMQSEYYDDSPSKVNYRQIHIWNLVNGDKRALAPDGLSVGRALVSPDRNWIAYRIREGSPTIVEDLDTYGQNQKVYPFILEDKAGEEYGDISAELRQSSLVQWANDNYLVLNLKHENTESYFAFNPFSGEKQYLPEDPNDMYLFGWHLTWLTVYDPSLTFRLYLNDSYEIALENMTTGEVVGAYPGSSTKPQWLPHEPIFLARLPGKDKDGWDLYSISIDGDQRKVVDVVSNLTRGGITRVEVSPDGKKVAFWVTKDLYYGGLRLGVVDLETLETTIYNLTSVIRLHEPGIVWSPDGTKLLVEVITMEEQQVFLADLEAGWAVKIADDMSPIGWLK